MPARTRRGWADHPRIRGEHAAPSESDKWDEGSSPHTRGAPSPPRMVRFRRGIIPAYAGSTHLWRPCPRRPGDHPRIRGEHHRPTHECRPFAGSSPHTRGAPLLVGGDISCLGIIPAYAGSTWPPPPPVPGPPGSSPHTRGARKAGAGARTYTRIIPAYAGSTSIVKPSERGLTGSSPHTRGALSDSAFV